MLQIFSYSKQIIFTGNCPHLTIPHGRVVQVNTIGDSAIYECNKGYSLYGNNVRQCQNDGKWSGVNPGCSSKSFYQNVIIILT